MKPSLILPILGLTAFLGACQDGRTPVASLSAPNAKRTAEVPARLTSAGSAGTVSTLILGLN